MLKWLISKSTKWSVYILERNIQLASNSDYVKEKFQLAEDDSADFDPEKEKRGKKRPATDAAGEAGDEPENKKEVTQNEDEAKADA